jgi:hypothetical protein
VAAEQASKQSAAGSQDLPASQQTGSEDLSASKQAARETFDFDVAIAPVEELAGDVLTGHGRTTCEEAFDRDPGAFLVCVRRTLSRRNVRAPLGLLVRIVHEDHALVSRVRRERESAGTGTVAITPAEGAERWMRDTGFRFDRDDALTILDDTFRLCGDELERLLALWHQLQHEQAAARADVERSLRVVQEEAA